MSTISKPVMVHQESNYVYRPPVKSEVLVSPSGPLQGCFRGVDMGCPPWLLLLPLEEKRGGIQTHIRVCNNSL